jgi:hypothetical protein
VGQIVSFSCEGRTAATGVYYSGSASNPTTGWQYRVNGGTWITSTSALPTQSNILSRSLTSYTIDLRATGTVAAGTSGTVTLRADFVTCVLIICGSPVNAYTVTIQATRVAPTPSAADLLLSCTPASITVGAGQSQTVSCTYSGRASLGNRQVTLSRLVIPAPSGWSISGPVGSVAGSTFTITPNATIAYSATTPLSYGFTFSLVPSCTSATTAQPVNLTSTFAFNSTTGLVGATFAEQIARSPASSLAVSVRSSSLAWNQTYSLTDSTVAGNFTYRVVANTCSGWNVSVSASPYTYIGSHQGTAISASNLQLTNSLYPIVVAGNGSGVSRQETNGSMITSHKVLNATSGSGIGTYDHQLNFQFTIPGKSRVGTYQSTVTVTSAAAP